jgi:hypothetical protein
MATISSELIRRLSDSLILPFNCNNYARELEKALDQFEKTHSAYLNKMNISFDYFKASVHNFTLASSYFMKRLSKLDKTQ